MKIHFNMTKAQTKLIGFCKKLFTKEDYQVINSTIIVMTVYANYNKEYSIVYQHGLDMLLTLKPQYLAWLPKYFLRLIFNHRKKKIIAIINPFIKYGKEYLIIKKQPDLHKKYPELFYYPEITLLRAELLLLDKHRYKRITSDMPLENINYFRLYSAIEYHTILILRDFLKAKFISYEDKCYRVLKENMYKTICLLNNGPTNSELLQNKDLMLAHKTRLIRFCHDVINQHSDSLQYYFDSIYDTLQSDLRRLDNEANFKIKK